jgi:hypothetical protein
MSDITDGDNRKTAVDIFLISIEGNAVECRCTSVLAAFPTAGLLLEESNKVPTRQIFLAIPHVINFLGPAITWMHHDG